MELPLALCVWATAVKKVRAFSFPFLSSHCCALPVSFLSVCFFLALILQFPGSSKSSCTKYSFFKFPTCCALLSLHSWGNRSIGQIIYSQQELNFPSTTPHWAESVLGLWWDKSSLARDDIWEMRKETWKDGCGERCEVGCREGGRCRERDGGQGRKDCKVLSQFF